MQPTGDADWGNRYCESRRRVSTIRGLFWAARSGDFTAPQQTDWLEAYDDQIRNAVNPTGKLHSVGAR